MREISCHRLLPPQVLKDDLALENQQTQNLRETVRALYEAQHAQTTALAELGGQLEKERGAAAALGKLQSDTAADLDFVTRMKDMAESDARAALSDSRSAIAALDAAQQELKQLQERASVMESELQRLRSEATLQVQAKNDDRERSARLAHHLVEEVCDLTDILRGFANDAASHQKHMWENECKNKQEREAVKEKERIREAEKEEEQRERERAQAAIEKEQTEWRKKESETRGILMSERIRHEEEKAALQEEASGVQCLLASAQLQIDELTSDVESLTARAAAASAEGVEIRNLLERERKVRAELTSAVDELREQLEDARVEETCKDAILKDWRNGLEILMHETMDVFGLMQQEGRRLQHEIAAERAYQDEACQALQRRVEEADILTGRLQKENRSLSARVKHIQEAHEDTLATLDKVYAELADKQEKTAALQESCDVLSSELAERQQKCSSLECELQTWSGIAKICDGLRDELGRMKHDHACSLTTANESLLRAESRIQELQQALDDAGRELESEKEVVACLSALRNSIIAEDFKDEVLNLSGLVWKPEKSEALHDKGHDNSFVYSGDLRAEAIQTTAHHLEEGPNVRCIDKALLQESQKHSVDHDRDIAEKEQLNREVASLKSALKCTLKLCEDLKAQISALIEEVSGVCVCARV